MPLPHHTRPRLAQLSRAHCAICAAPLTVHQEVRGGVCDAARCKRTALLRALAKRRREEAEAVRLRASAWRQEAASALGIAAPESLALGVLPNNDRPLVRSSARRRRAFREYLVQLVDEAVHPDSDARARTGSQSSPAPSDPDEIAMLGMACATCRGHCCRTGGNHAYLDVETVRRYMTRWPALSPAAVIGAFLSRLPARSYRDSCIYQGRDGCSLPRDMRADICNSFQCDGLAELRRQLALSPHAGAFAVATNGDQLLRATVFDHKGVRQRVRRRRRSP